ncbi:MAG: hypothetical protein HRU20_15880 [Pseudomonadales bacterium]|nr:hypothetical protein [Pseudomonadales bacterium]
MNILVRLIEVLAITAIILSCGGFLLTAFDVIQLHRYVAMNVQDFLFLCLIQVALSIFIIMASQMLINRDDAAKSLFPPVLLAQVLFILSW